MLFQELGTLEKEVEGDYVSRSHTSSEILHLPSFSKFIETQKGHYIFETYSILVFFEPDLKSLADWSWPTTVGGDGAWKRDVSAALVLKGALNWLEGML